MSKRKKSQTVSSAKERIGNEISRTKREIAGIKSKQRLRTAGRTTKKRIIFVGLKTMIVRCIEVFSITMLGFLLVIGIGANVIPMAAIMIAQEIGMPELIQGLAGKDASGIVSAVCTIFANWGLPMIFICLAVVIIFSKLLFVVSRKIHKFCTGLIGGKDEDSAVDEDDDSDFSDATND